MGETPTPGEKRAEAYRQQVVKLKGEAMTTKELLEAADAIHKAAEVTIKGNKKFLEKIGRELEKSETKNEI